MDTNRGVPPNPLPALLVHLCFMGALGVVATTITAPSRMRVPFGIVTCLSCLAWILVFEWWPCWFFTLPFMESIRCRRAVVVLVASTLPFPNCYLFRIFSFKIQFWRCVVMWPAGQWAPYFLIHSLMTLAMPRFFSSQCPRNLCHLGRGPALWLPRVLLPQWDIIGGSWRNGESSGTRENHTCFQHEGPQHSEFRETQTRSPGSVLAVQFTGIGSGKG